jgi:hypothetical protein
MDTVYTITIASTQDTPHVGGDSFHPSMAQYQIPERKLLITITG